MDYPRKSQYDIGDLIEIVRILRAPGGCPWDREQTHTSIRKNLIEESYEVADAIDKADMALLCEELGDLLLQVALHAQMEAEAGGFTFDDVCDGICKKLIYRHPHVFAPHNDALTSDEVLVKWEELKNTEKGRESAADRLDSVPSSLPALMRSEKIQKRAADYGFRYINTIAALADLDSEMSELGQALSQNGNVAEEVGDVLFSAVNVARMQGVDAEEALSASTVKFARRVKATEALAAAEGKTLEQLDAEELDVLYRRAKAGCE